MNDEARQIAEQLRSADQLRRFAEADVLTLICALAEQYEVDYDEVIDVLAERKVVVGGIGTPAVSEFIALELAGLLRCTLIVAAAKLADALNLKHRHPRLFAEVRHFELEPARACKAANLCGDLPAAVADEVTARWVGKQEALGWTAAFNLLKRLILDADPARAAEQEERRREDRGVHVWGRYEGVMNLTGRLDVLDAAARVDKAGHITTALLSELLPCLDVTIQPVIDLPNVPTEDHYVPSVQLKRALLLAFEHEMFLYSAHRSRGLDLDHTQPYTPGYRDQTRIGNLIPASRRVHRAKTARAWRVDQPRPGQLYWLSPLGYRYEVAPSGTRMLA